HELLRRLGKLWNDLEAGGAGPDDTDALVMELRQVAGGVATGVVVLPAGAVEGASLEVLDPRDAWQLRTAEDAALGDDEPRTERVAVRGLDDPAGVVLVPDDALDLGLEDRPAVQIEVLGEGLAVREDLRAGDVPLGRHVPGLLQV